MDKLDRFGLLFRKLYYIFLPLRFLPFYIGNLIDILQILLTRHKLLLLLFITSLIPFLGTAQEVSVSGPTDSLTVGTLFNFSLTLNNKSEYDKIIFPDSSIFNDDLEFISRKQFRLPNFSDSTSYSLQFFANKDIIIPPLPVKLIEGADTTLFFTEAFPLFFKTVLSSENDELNPLKPNFDFSLVLWPWILGALLLSALAYFLYQKFYKDRTPPIQVVREIPEFVSPLVELEQRLEFIKEEHTQSVEKDYKLFYSQLGDAIRAYLENLYAIPALESTTRELARYMDAFGVDLDLIKYTRLILNEADMIKFAKMIPTLDQSWVAYQHAQAFLERALVYDIQRIARLKERFESQFEKAELELDQEDGN